MGGGAELALSTAAARGPGRRLADRGIDRRARRASSASKTSSSPRRRKSPARSGTTARCWPKTPGSRCARSSSASPAASSPASSSPLSCTSRRRFAAPTYPLLVASQAIPIVVIAPILIVWFGYGIGPKLAIVALICFFPITVNALDGLRSVDPEAIKLMRTPRRLALADLPPGRGARPRCPTSSAAPRSRSRSPSIGAVFAEWAGSSSGLGVLILQSTTPNCETARLFAAVVVLSAMAIALFGLAGPRRAARRHLAIEHRG